LLFINKIPPTGKEERKFNGETNVNLCRMKTAILFLPIVVFMKIVFH